MHGCLFELQQLLQKCEYQPDTDALVFVGDLVGKGPNSLGVLEFAKKQQALVVMGNHDLSLLKHLRGDPTGRKEWDRLIEEMGSRKGEWMNYIQSWPKYIEFDDFIVVHAGMVPEQTLEETSIDVLCTIRTWDGKGIDLNRPGQDPPWYELYKGAKPVIYGHWALQGLHVTQHTVGLDSGCVYGGKLSAWVNTTGEILQVSAKKAYRPV